MKTLTQPCPIQLISTFSTSDKKDERLMKMQSYSIFSSTSINSPIHRERTTNILSSLHLNTINAAVKAKNGLIFSGLICRRRLQPAPNKRLVDSSQPEEKSSPRVHKNYASPMDLERGERRDLFEKTTLVGLSVSNNQASIQDQPIGSYA